MSECTAVNNINGTQLHNSACAYLIQKLIIMLSSSNEPNDSISLSKSHDPSGRVNSLIDLS